MKKISIEPIGFVETSLIETATNQNNKGTIIMKPEFSDGIYGLKENDMITVVFNFHKSDGYKLITPTCMSDVPTGVFSTRSPFRPNALGITTVKITKITKNRIEFLSADMINGTPVIDIKPAI